MEREPVTRLQASGHRFLARRLEHALVRGDARMVDDPLGAQSTALAVGSVLTAVAIAVCAALAFLRPAGDLGDAPIVLARDTGAMYVRIGDHVHPVFNLASARLIAGAAAEPHIVAQRSVDAFDRGPAVGIPGAPQHIPPALSEAEAQWTVCEDTRTELTTAILGPAEMAQADVAASADRGVLVTARGESAAATYLLYSGWRARVDLRHPAVVRALKLDGVVPRPVSPALLAATPEAPAIVPPQIPAGRSLLPEQPVGTVFRVPGEPNDLFVVLPDGVQRIGEVAADLIRYTDARAGQELPSVSADRIGALPVVGSLPVTTYPQHAGVSPDPVVCARWNPGTQPHTALLTGAELPRAAAPVTLAQADGGGPALDAVSIPPGRSAYVRPVGLTGGGHLSGPGFFISDSGVRFGVVDADAAAALGLPDRPVPAPWPVVAELPGGPDLSRAAASLVRDGIGTMPQPSP